MSRLIHRSSPARAHAGIASAILVAILGGCGHRVGQRGHEGELPKQSSEPDSDESVVPIPFEDARGRFGFRNATGKVVIPPMFSVAGEFEGRPAPVAFVADDTAWRCIDTRGQTLALPYVFDNGPDPLISGRARALTEDGQIYYLGTGCQRAFAGTWSFATEFDDKLAFVCHDCKAERDGEHVTHTGRRWQVINLRGAYISMLESDARPRWSRDKQSVVLSVEGKQTLLFPDGRVAPGADLRFVQWQVDGLDPRFLASAFHARDREFDRCLDTQVLRPERVLIVGRADVAAPPRSRAGQSPAADIPVPNLESAISGLAVTGTPSGGAKVVQCLEGEARGALASVLPVVAGQGWTGAFRISIQVHPGDVPPTQVQERSDETITFEEDGSCMLHREYPCAPHKICMAPEQLPIDCPEDLGVARASNATGGIDRAMHLRLRGHEVQADGSARDVEVRVSVSRRRDLCEIEWELPRSGADVDANPRGFRVRTPIHCTTFDSLWTRGKALTRQAPRGRGASTGSSKSGPSAPAAGETANTADMPTARSLQLRLDLLWMSGRATAYQAAEIDWRSVDALPRDAPSLLCDLSTLATASQALAPGWRETLEEVEPAGASSKRDARLAATYLPAACEGLRAHATDAPRASP